MSCNQMEKGIQQLMRSFLDVRWKGEAGAERIGVAEGAPQCSFTPQFAVGFSLVTASSSGAPRGRI